MSESDADLARRLAATVGEILLVLQSAGTHEGMALGKTADATANAWLMDELRSHRPDDAILSEEEKDSAERLSCSRVWIVDPLDGTREYSEGRSDWAVHVALAIDGVACIGAVALPGLGMTLTSCAPSPLQPVNLPLRMLVSRTRPAKEAVTVAQAIDAQIVAMGSAGAKAMAVVRGEAEIYLHTGGQYEWDNCAPVAVAQAFDLHCSRIDGTPLAYNRPDAYLADLLICRREVADRVLSEVAKLTLVPAAGTESAIPS